MDWELITRLMNCFPKSFINQNGEFIAHAETNQYFILRDCKTELDIKCKVIEWFSRAACKTWPFDSARRNKQFQKFMLNGVNEFLETNFTAEEMEVVYTYLGNSCNHDKTIVFVLSGYDMKVLKSED